MSNAAIHTPAEEDAERGPTPSVNGDSHRPLRTKPARTGWALRLFFQLLFLGGLGAGAWFTYVRINAMQAGKSQEAAKKGQRVIPVIAAEARMGDMPIYLDSLGTVTPLNTVTVKSRIDGEIVKVGFEEGQQVKAGDLLVQIDPRPYEIMLSQSQGTLQRDEAMLKNARNEQERARRLLAARTIGDQEYDTQTTTVRQLEGTVATDKAAVDNARLQLEYCRILSPIAGRIGLRKIDVGNYVRAADPTGVAVVTQTRPITIVFTVLQDDISRVQLQNTKEPLTVEVHGRDLGSPVAVGKVSAIDNQVDIASGTVKVRATFDNNDDLLYPSQFVNVRLLIETRRGVVIVPASAVQHGPDSVFVYVVKPDPEDPKKQKVYLRTVSIGHTERDQTIVMTGLEAGELVVTQGVDKLQSETIVEARSPEAAKKAAKEVQNRAASPIAKGAPQGAKGEVKKRGRGEKKPQ